MGIGADWWSFLQACESIGILRSIDSFVGCVHLQQQFIIIEEKGKKSNKKHCCHVYIIEST